MGTLESHATSLEAQKFRAPMQPIDRREAQMRAHCELARLLGRDRDRQAHAALGAAALEYLASARRGHPCQKSMSSYASSVMRLVSPFHCTGPASLSFEFRPNRPVNRLGISRRQDRFTGCTLDRPRTRNRTIPHAIEQAPRPWKGRTLLNAEPTVGSAPPWAGVTPVPTNRKMARTPFCSQVLFLCHSRAKRRIPVPILSPHPVPLRAREGLGVRFPYSPFSRGSSSCRQIEYEYR